MQQRISIFNDSLAFDNEPKSKYERLGTTEEKAYELISNNLIKVHDILKPSIERLLMDFEFIYYLRKNNLSESVVNAFGEYMLTFLSKGNIIPYVENLKRFAKDLVIAQAYINYSFRDEKIDSEGIDTCVIQALIYLNPTINNLSCKVLAKDEKKDADANQVLTDASKNSDSINLKKISRKLF